MHVEPLCTQTQTNTLPYNTILAHTNGCIPTARQIHTTPLFRCRTKGTDELNHQGKNPKQQQQQRKQTKSKQSSVGKHEKSFSEQHTSLKVEGWQHWRHGKCALYASHQTIISSWHIHTYTYAHVRMALKPIYVSNTRVFTYNRQRFPIYNE